MSNWKDCTLANLGEIVGGATPSTNNEGYFGGDVPWITPKDLATLQGRFIRRGERSITAHGLESCSARLMPAHSVLFTSRAPIGYIAIAENEVCTNQGFKSVVPNSDTDYLFLYYLLAYNRDKIENMGSGTTFKEVSGSVMKKITVSVPANIKEQRAIAQILGSLDDKIENNMAINHHLEQVARAVFQGTVRNIKEFGSILEFADLLSGGTPNTAIGSYWNGDIEWVSAKDVSNANGIFLLDTEKKITQDGLDHSTTKLLPAKTVVVTARGTVGAHGILAKPMTMNQTNYGLKAKEGIGNYFVFFTLSEMVGQLKQQSYGTIFDTITTKTFQNALCPQPSTEVIHKFERQVSPLMNTILNNLFESARLAAIRDALLPRLMSGELSVDRD